MFLREGTRGFCFGMWGFTAVLAESESLGRDKAVSSGFRLNDRLVTLLVVGTGAEVRWGMDGGRFWGG